MARKRKSIISQLPPDVRRELERCILAEDYGTERDLAAWLAARGFTIAISTLNRYAARLRELLDSIPAMLTKGPSPENMPIEELFRERGKLVMFKSQIARREEHLDREICRRCRLQSEAREIGA